MRQSFGGSRAARTASLLMIPAITSTAVISTSAASAADTQSVKQPPQQQNALAGYQPTGATVLATGPGFTVVANGLIPGVTPMQLGAGSNAAATAKLRSNLEANCGYITCSVYLSQRQTRTANYDISLYGGGIAGLAAACGIIGAMSGPAVPYVVAACGVTIAVEGALFLNAVTHAASDNGCLRIRYGALPTWFYDDHSQYCAK